MKWVALMPLRGGSKSIPRKNLKMIAGKPLFYWGLQAAIESEIFSEIFVSTDCSEIAEAIQRWTPSVKVLMRPSEFATDEASTESVMLHFASIQPEFAVLGLIQATSPLVKAEDFRQARAQFERDQADSLATAVEWKRFFWDQDYKPVNYDPQRRPRRQEFAGWLMENGAFYFTKKTVLEQQKCRLGGKVSIFTMGEETAIEIDNPVDWTVVETLLTSEKVKPRLSQIRYLVVDVDGTLTDGGMYYSSDGEMGKRFDTRDWKGLQLVENSGIKVCIMTGEDSPSVHARLKKVPLSHYHFGVKDKLPLVQKLMREWQVDWNQVAFIGDDLGDLSCLEQVGFSACPEDAVEDVKTVVDYVCRKGGGKGAVREVCDLLLRRDAK